MAPPLGLTRASSNVDAHQLEAAQHLARERLVELDHVHVLERQPGALERLLRRRHRARAP